MNSLTEIDSYVHGWLFVGLITTMALAVYLFTLIKVGQARGKFGVAAPATSGHPDFERYLRAQVNTLENIVIFLPSLWLFAGVCSPKLAAFLGLIWVAGRIVYARGYYQAAEKRLPGFIISMVASAILLFGSMLGLVIKII